MKVFHSCTSEYWFVALAIGDKCYSNFELFCLPFALQYCINNNINLACVTSDIFDADTASCISGKKKTWQKFLIPQLIFKKYPTAKLVCYFDSDILFNPYAGSIFSLASHDVISLVSMKHNLPYDDFFCRKTISFLRNRYYSSDYPLDSAIFMSYDDIYRYHGFKVFDDFACAGLFVCPKQFASNLSMIYYKYDIHNNSLTSGGDQPAFNFEIRSNFPVGNLPYSCQALWSWEMAHRYRHLYTSSSLKDINNAITSTLLSNLALHFAGSWPDSRMYMNTSLFSYVYNQENLEFFRYLSLQPQGIPLGTIKSP
tara:strand:+ start:760 stop:1695 length:936 start_codon:yes stop_codon:yes gene_type:complete